MRLLIIETSTERAVIACVEDNEIVFNVQLPPGLQNSQFVMPTLHQALMDAQLKIDNIEAIVVGIGPGSYTGIRVGVTVAKTLAFAKKLPLIGISSLDGFVPEKNGKFAVVIDAKIGGVYVKRGNYLKGHITEESPPEVRPLEQAAEMLSEYPLLITPQAHILRPKMEAFQPSSPWQWQECYPSPLRLADIAKEKLLKGDYDREGNLELLYMRKTQAEIEREKLQS